MPHHFPFLLQPLQIERASRGAELTERGEMESEEEEAKEEAEEERLDPGENEKEARWRMVKLQREK